MTRVVLGLLVALSPARLPAAGPAYVLTDLGTLGGTYSESLGINAAGQVVGGSTVASGNFHAYVYTGGLMVDLGMLTGGNESEATAINGLGQVTGWSNNGSLDLSGNPETQAVIFSGGNLTSLGVLGNDTSSMAFGINDSGNIVGQSLTGTTDSTAFFSSGGGGLVNLGPLSGGNNSDANAINNAGQIAGWSSTGGNDTNGNPELHAVLYPAGGGNVTDLGVLAGQDDSIANALNATGSVVGYSYNSGNATHAFWWTLGNGMVDLGTLPNGSGAQATGINASGQIVGWGDIGMTDLSGDTIFHAFLYVNGEMDDLNNLTVNAAGWTIEFASGINDSGQISGFGISPSGQTHAFVLTPEADSPPVIINQPVSQSVTLSNNTAVFTVTAGGATPLSYQWQLNGTNISGATRDTLTLNNVQSSDAGLYTVVVSNSLGNVTGGPAKLSFLSYGIIDLGTLGGTSSVAQGLNAIGQVVGYSTTKLGATHAFVYSGGKMTDLGVLPGGSLSEATGINSAGQISGWGDNGKADSLNQPVYHAFFYAAGKMTDLNSFSVDLDTQANAINESGVVVGQSYTNTLASSDNNAFVYAAGQYATLGHLPGGAFSAATGLNNSGEIVGWSDTGGGTAGVGQYHAVFYALNGNISDLGTLPGQDDSIASGINDYATVIGYSYTASSPLNLACFWTPNGGVQGLGVLPGGSSSQATGINDFGQIVGASDVGVDASDNVIEHVFIYSDGAMYDASNLTVNAAGWTSMIATGINEAGQIVGYGSNPSGQTHAFLLVNTVEPSVTTQPGNQTATAGSAATFTTAGGGFPAPTFQWQVLVQGNLTWVNLTDGGNITGSANATLTVGNTTTALSGNQYRVIVTNAAGSSTSNAVVLTVNPGAPVIKDQPASVEVFAGNTTEFTVTAEGAANLTYQWMLKGKKIVGATKASYTIAKVAAANAGNYTVLITNSLGHATSGNATLTLGTLPKITTQPAAQTVKLGQTATFKTAASGSPAPAVQWQYSTDAGKTWGNLTNGNQTSGNLTGGMISGATSVMLMVGNTTAAMSGVEFRAVATSTLPTVSSVVDSKAAKLTVDSPPSITTPPTDQTTTVGGSAQFSVVTAANPLAVKYQWQFIAEGQSVAKNVTGATKATLKLTKVTVAKAGSYQVIVTNVAGSVTGGPVTLTVN